MCTAKARTSSLIHIDPEFRKTTWKKRVLDSIVHRDGSRPYVRKCNGPAEWKEDVENFCRNFFFNGADNGCIAEIIQLPEQPQCCLCAYLLEPGTI